MRKRVAKFMAVLLAAGMTLSMVACGDQNVVSSETNTQETEQTTASVATEPEEDLYYNKEGYPICDEPITLKVSGMIGNSPDWNNTLFVKHIEEKLGIKLECETFAKEAWNTQYALMLSTGELPDLIINGNMDKAQINKDGENGFWLDLSQYMDLMPNYAKMLEENAVYSAYTQTSTGAIYSVNRLTPGKASAMNLPIFANTALLEGAGVKADEIKTVDDFYNALVAVKAAYPDKIPLSFTPDVAPAARPDVILRTAFGIASKENSYVLVADEAGKVSLADISDNNREYLKFMNKLYEEKLMDQNAFITTKDEYRANEKAKKYVFFSDQSGLSYALSDGESQADYSMLFALTSDVSSETTYTLYNNFSTGARVFVNAKTEYPEAIARLIDYMCTEEGYMLAAYGIEGQTYDLVVDEFGVPSVDHSKYADLTKYSSATEWLHNEVTIDQAMNMLWSFLPSAMDDLDNATLNKIVEANGSNALNARRILALEDIDNVVEAIPALPYNEDEVSSRSTMRTDILNYLVQMKVSFITGEIDVEDNKAWNDYVAKVKEMGYDKLMEIEQAAYDRYVAGLK